MRISLILALIILVQPDVAFAQQSSVTLENIQAEYKSLAEVKPVLANGWDQPIYLLPKECGEAQVSFVKDGYWSYSDPFDCPQIAAPIEIKPGEIYSFPSLLMRLEQAEGEFYEQREGVPGRYVIEVSYSLNPTFRHGRPELRYLVTKEFRIVK
ncbi:MAG TPA: hypothetical protein VF708_13435 [Pyrinomonadaceae bacterium]|jgi:hypothetical protein